MAKQNRTTLKGYFETGDVPNQSQYGDLIDSKLNLSDTGTQILTGTISASNFDASNNLTISGYISASGLISASTGISSSNIDLGGKITALTGSFGHMVGNLADLTGSITFEPQTIFQSPVTASIISASGHISCSGLIVGGSEINLLKGNITASGVISASGGFIGGVTSTGTGTFANVNTGQGASQVHLMNQNVQTTDAVVFATVDTGQGANELFDMNQNVLTTSNVTFDGVTISKDTFNTAIAALGDLTIETSRAFTLGKVSIPEISKLNTSPVYTINNEAVTTTSVIHCSMNNTDLQVFIGAISAGQFEFYFFNPTADTTVAVAIQPINFVIL